MPMYRVLLLEDDEAVRQSLGALIENSEKLKLIGTCASAREGTCLLALEPDFVLVDLMLEDGLAYDFITCAKSDSETRVLVISVLGDEESVLGAIQAGADGYIKKESSQDELLNAFDAVLRGEAPMSPTIARHLLRQIRANQPLEEAPNGAEDAVILTPRERQVLEALAQGLNYKEVARKYELSHHTVAKYIKTIYRKMAVHTRAEAVVEGMRSGLIKVGER